MSKLIESFGMKYPERNIELTYNPTSEENLEARRESLESLTTIDAGACTPERAEALRQAASEVSGVAVSVLDPAVPNEAARYANTKSRLEMELFRAGYQRNPYPNQARTPEEITRGVVAPALLDGRVLVLISKPSSQHSLSAFWQRADELTAAQPSAEG